MAHAMNSKGDGKILKNSFDLKIEQVTNRPGKVENVEIFLCAGSVCLVYDDQPNAINVRYRFEVDQLFTNADQRKGEHVTFLSQTFPQKIESPVRSGLITTVKNK